MQELQKIEQIPAFLEPVKDKFNALVDAVIELSKLSGDGGRTITIENGVIRCTLQPGGGFGGYAEDAAEYNGYFKVVPSTTGMVKVVDGADVTSTTCGSFTVGSSNITCTATEVSVSGPGVVYLRIYYRTSYYYAFGFAETLPSVNQEIYITLASIADGVPAQVWTGGAITYLNGSYVL